MAAEIEERQPVSQRLTEEIARRPGHEHLTSVRGGADPGSEMHVEPDVAFGDPPGLARVRAHAHANGQPVGPRVRVERLLRPSGGLDSLARAIKRDEEGVSLCIDLDAATLLECLPEQPPVRLERLPVPVAERVEQPRRPFDVGEEKRDRARREVVPHGGRILERDGRLPRQWRA